VKKPAGAKSVVAIGLAAAVAIASVIWCSWEFVVRPARAARLPVLPNLAGRPEPLAVHVRDADAAARRWPVSAQAVGNLCTTYHADEFFDQAAQCYDLVTELSPRDWHWRYYEALLQFDRGRVEQALDRLHDAVQLNPRYAPAWFRLGEEASKRGGSEEARLAYERARSVDETPASAIGAAAAIPTAAYATWGLARMMQRDGDLDGARKALEQLVTEVPGFGAAHRTLGEVYAAQGRPSESDREKQIANRSRPYTPPADLVRDALVASSNNGGVLLKAASMAERAGDIARRELLTRRALEVDARNPQAVYRMGILLRDLGRPADALPFFEQHRQLAPSESATLTQIGLCLVALRRLDQAEKVFRDGIALHDDATARFNLALALQGLGRFDEAIPHYRAAIEKNPADAAPHNNLAVGFSERGDAVRALEHYERALVLQPDNADAHVNLGLLLQQLHRRQEAMREVERALELDPSHVKARELLGRR